MFNCFFPDEYLDSTYVINFDDLYAQGYRGLLFDIDNTLVPHGAPADERACALFAHLKELGFKCCFLSNNQYERVSIHSILVTPMNPKEEIQIVLKRYLERIVLYFYRKEEGNS